MIRNTSGGKTSKHCRSYFFHHLCMRTTLVYSDRLSNHQIKAENPDMKTTDISKVLGEKWRGMDENAKASFQRKADADKERCVAHISVNRE